MAEPSVSANKRTSSYPSRYFYFYAYLRSFAIRPGEASA
jgi:hypothetical protein